MQIIFALVLSLLIAGCGTTATRSIGAQATSCYRSTDGLRYNSFYLQLKPRSSYKIVLQGDIGTWGEASGDWSQESGTVTLSQKTVKGLIEFPTRFNIQRNGSLKFDYQGAGYSDGGTNLMPSECES